MKPKTPVVIRFKSKFTIGAPEECWLWTAATNAAGYGVIGRGGRGELNVLAHRLSYELHIGLVPDGLIVCHTCDNPPCVNPHHLFLGTHKTNAEDRVAKGRQFRGETANGAKLTADQVREIRMGAASGLTQASMVARYGMSTGQISRIVSRKQWAHIA